MHRKRALAGIALLLTGMALSGCMEKAVEVELLYGQQYEIEDEDLAGYEDLTYETDDQTVVALDGRQVEAIGPGETEVYIKNGDTSVKTYKFSVKVVPVTGIVLSTDNCEVMEEEQYQLGYTLFPTDASDYGLTWMSADEAVAGVTQEGVITGISAGETTVTVSTEDGLLEKCHVSVKKKAAYDRLSEPERQFVDVLMTCIYDFKSPPSVKVTAVWDAGTGEIWSFRATAQNSYGGSNTSSYCLMENTLIRMPDDYEVPDSGFDLALINEAIQEKLI